MPHFKIKPSCLTLYITKNCNARCPNCIWFLQDKSFFSKLEMPIGTAKDIIKKYYKDHKVRAIRIHAEGDVLTCSYWQELFLFSKKLGVTSDLVTNGMGIKEHLDFISRCVGKVVISLDGYNAETYIRHRGANEQIFDNIIENIKSLVKLKSRKKIFVGINCIVSESDYEKIIPMIALGENLNIDSVRFGNYHPVAGDIKPLYNESKIINYFEKIMNKNTYKVNITLPGLFNNKPGPYFCSMLFSTALIGSDGCCTPCCHEYSQPKYGRYDTDGHNGKPLVEFRKHFLKAKIKDELPSICQNCPRRFFKKDKFFVKSKKWKRKL